MAGANNDLEAPFDPLVTMPSDASDALGRQVLRNIVQQIVSSYHQTYDHLQEAIQNAVDACQEAYWHYQEERDGITNAGHPYAPEVQITVDLTSDEITVVDNGPGMTRDDVQKYFFSPYATLKRVPKEAGREQRGEKGVGATFLAYGSSSLRVTSKPIDGTTFTAGVLNGGIEWIRAEDSQAPAPEVRPCQPHTEIANGEHGTAITMRFSGETNIRQLARHGTTPEHWDTILRLFTALGYIDFEERDEFLTRLRATISVVTQNGKTRSKPVGAGHLYPDRVPGVSAARIAELQATPRPLPIKLMHKDCLHETYSWPQLKEKLSKQLESASYTRFLDQKEELFEAMERYQPECYALFAWSSEFWSDVNTRVFATRRREFDYGMVFATKRQRIGRTERIQFSTRAGDYNRFLFVVNLKDATADIGRKSLPGEITDLAWVIADTLHMEFVRSDDALKPAPSEAQEQDDLALEELQTKAIGEGQDIEDAQRLGLHLLKVPREEQDVVALFFDLLGAGYLKGFEFYSTLVSGKYDAVAAFELQKSPDVLYDHKTSPLGIPEEKFRQFPPDTHSVRSAQRSFLEFKLSSDDLVRDFRRQDKRPSDIRWLVCWDVGSAHRAEGYEIVDVLTEDQRNWREYYGVTHVLRTREGTQINLICLKTVLDVLRQQLQ